MASSRELLTGGAVGAELEHDRRLERQGWQVIGRLLVIVRLPPDTTKHHGFTITLECEVMERCVTRTCISRFFSLLASHRAREELKRSGVPVGAARTDTGKGGVAPKGTGAT
jgi:hypothetical protein